MNKMKDYCFVERINRCLQWEDCESTLTKDQIIDFVKIEYEQFLNNKYFTDKKNDKERKRLWNNVFTSALERKGYDYNAAKKYADAALQRYDMTFKDE